MTQARKTVGGNGFSVCGKAFERGFGTKGTWRVAVTEYITGETVYAAFEKGAMP